MTARAHSCIGCTGLLRAGVGGPARAGEPSRQRSRRVGRSTDGQPPAPVATARSVGPGGCSGGPIRLNRRGPLMPKPSTPTPRSPTRPVEGPSRRSGKRRSSRGHLALDLDVTGASEQSAEAARLEVTDRLLGERVGRLAGRQGATAVTAPHLANAARTLAQILARRQPGRSWIVKAR